ncbi:hypothetical protein [Glutamicibacter nicotianae]|uniref:hypothetical protein n=1 Tax=Glutamicibacter nicotianae TaxID=37929 RepID=UPI0025549199|nr:hypothetical protein [Glutamicibacter nicotianae]WIV45304.1 hypothetical protein QQS42_06850 [Glutamicibacter nicotianae]
MNRKASAALALGTIALLATACAATEDAAPGTSPTASQSSPAAAESSSAQPSSTASVQAADIVPTLENGATDQDKTPELVTDPEIDQDSIRALAQMSYAKQYAAVNDSGELCLIAWAYDGSQDANGTMSEQEVECEDSAEVKEEGLHLDIDATSSTPGVELYLLPPDLTEETVRTELLKIEGNHEDLRPPVEFAATDFGLVSIAMEAATAENHKEITIPRPDGSILSLDLN